MAARFELTELAVGITVTVVVVIIGVFIAAQIHGLTPTEQQVVYSVVNETFNSGEYDTWVQLNHTNIVENSETVTDLTGATTYTRGTDYEMNYTAGQIKVLSTGSMSNNTNYLISYDYTTTEPSVFSAANSAAVGIMNTCVPLLVVLAVAIVAVVIIREVVGGFGGGE